MPRAGRLIQDDTATPAALDATLLEAVDRGRIPRVYDMSPGLWCVRLPIDYPRVASVNAYLVALRDGWLLVDTGTDVDTLESALRLTGVTPEAICALLVTHAHSDHSALAATLAERHGWQLLRGRGPVMSLDALRDPAEPLGDRRRAGVRAGVLAADLELMTDAVITGRLGSEDRRPADRIVGSGDRLVGPDATWVVIAMPGHAPGQVGLWDPAHRRLIGADIAYPTGIPFVHWGHSQDPLTEHENSLRRVAALDAALLLPGHGAPDPSPSGRINAARAQLRAVRARLVDAVRARPSTAYELACSLAPDNADPDVRQSHLSTTLSILDVLLANGRIAVDGSPLHDTARVYRAA